MTNRHCALLLFASVSLTTPAFGDSIDGTYAGERVLTQGDPGACGAKDAVSATINRDTLTFSNPHTKDYTISFNPRSDGSFAQLSADIGGKVVDIRGHVGNGVLDADVTAANCSHHWHMQRE
jgi:hypothetical protein